MTKKIFSEQSKVRFHSPLNLQVLAFPLAASSCCGTKTKMLVSEPLLGDLECSNIELLRVKYFNIEL